MLLAGPKIAKCAQEPGALGHLDQEFGDPHARKQGVEPAIESLRLGWSDRRHGLQLEPVAFERHAREPVRLELLGEPEQPPVERPCDRKRPRLNSSHYCEAPLTASAGKK